MNIDLDFFLDLLRIPSVSGNITEINRAVDCVKNYLEAKGVSCVVEDMNGLHILYASTMPGKEQDYILNAHLDVVPADTSQFEPYIEGDRLYARGADDCKGNCIPIINALCELNGKASIGAIFSTDEEIGGRTSEYMVNLGNKTRKMIIVSAASAYAIATCEKGAMNLTLTAHGKEGHSSRPWIGDNAIDKLIAGYSRLKEAWGSRVPGEDGDVWFDTLSAGIIRGGTAANKIPDVAEMVINIRFTRPGDENRIINFVRETTNLEVTCIDFFVPVFCDSNNSHILELKTTMENKWPERKIIFCKMCGATDARHFAKLNIPIAIIGVEGYDCHSRKEYVSLKNIAETGDMLIDFLG